MAKNFELIERIGISSVSISDAIKSAVFEARKERPVAWFEITDQRGRITDNGEIEYQITVKIGRKL